MNWLIYITGWFFGFAFVNSIIRTDTWIKLGMWTALWVWICWRFIA